MVELKREILFLEQEQRENNLLELIQKIESEISKLKKEFPKIRDFQAAEKKFGKEILEEETDPERKEMIRVLLGIGEVNGRNGLREKRERKEKINLAIEDVEWQQEAIRLIANWQGGKELLEKFWQVFEKLFKIEYMEDYVEQYKKGILAMIAVAKLFKKIGEEPYFSTPKEDAEDKIDLFVDPKIDNQVLAVQVETTPDYYFFDPVEVKPAFEMDEKIKKRSFFFSINNLKKNTGMNLKGVYILIPFSDIDSITGEPDNYLLEQFERDVNSKIKW